MLLPMKMDIIITVCDRSLGKYVPTGLDNLLRHFGAWKIRRGVPGSTGEHGLRFLWVGSSAWDIIRSPLRTVNRLISNKGT